jgi:hypothetical protein
LEDKYVQSLVVSGPYLFAGTNAGGVFFSMNNGSSWTSANTGLTNKCVPALAVVPNGTGGTNLFAGIYGGGVFVSTNDGADWTAANNGLTNDYVRVLAAKPNETGGMNLFAATYNAGIFLSTNNGSSWAEVNTGLTDNSILSLALIGPNILAGTDGGGICLSTNDGTSWSAANSGLTDTHIMALIPNDTYLFAGDVGGNVWRRPLLEFLTAVYSSSIELHKEFHLAQNYPNPFNPSTTISFDLPKNALVRCSIYDLLGREIAVLVNEKRIAGTYEVLWDGRDARHAQVPSGVYLYRLEAAPYHATGKLMLLK